MIRTIARLAWALVQRAPKAPRRYQPHVKSETANTSGAQTSSINIHEMQREYTRRVASMSAIPAALFETQNVENPGAMALARHELLAAHNAADDAMFAMMLAGDVPQLSTATPLGCTVTAEQATTTRFCEVCRIRCFRNVRG